MKFFLLLLVSSFLFADANLKAQGGNYHHALRGGAATRNGASTTSASSTLSTGHSGTGSNIDVIYHKIFWRLNPDSINPSTSASVKAIGGYVQFNFKTVMDTVNKISFDLNAVMGIDSVLYHNAKLDMATRVKRVGNVTTITLTDTIAINHIDSFRVYYGGTPPGVVGQAEGFQSNRTMKTPIVSPPGGSFIYTLSESYEDRDWWPCKADMKDKIDSMDIIVSVPWSGPDTFWVATNGKLIDSSIAGNSRTFTFRERYPIASYLVSLGVSRYKRYYRPAVNISGTNVPVVYNLFSGKTAGTYNSILTALDFSMQELSAFSNFYGDYAFKNEKHGYYEFGWGGGMEHQGFSAMGSSTLTDASVIAHELTHQWFGDKVTFATWNHLWLAEGFANYGEVLAAELIPGLGQDPVALRAGIKASAIATAQDTASVYIPDSYITNSDRIWSFAYGNTVYNRGCMVVSMLRTLVGDVIFKQACKNYLTNSAYGAAITDSLKNNFNALVTTDLTPFFTSWVMGKGHPVCPINWNTPAANKFAVSPGTQTQTQGASFFPTPIVLRLTAAGGKDTSIVIYDMGGGALAKAGNGIGPTTANVLNYTLSFTPTYVSFDTLSLSMAVKGAITKVGTLDLQIVDFSARNSGLYNEVFATLDDNTINAPMQLEKSGNGTSFTAVGNMDLQPALGTLKNYYFKDVNPYDNITYYRVKYRSSNGEFIYSRTVKVATGTKGLFSILNNPAKGTVNIKTAAAGAASYQVSIFDASGKIMTTGTIKPVNSIITININDFTKGIYLLKISDSGEVVSMKFLVE